MSEQTPRRGPSIGGLRVFVKKRRSFRAAVTGIVVLKTHHQIVGTGFNANRATREGCLRLIVADDEIARAVNYSRVIRSTIRNSIGR